MFNIGDTVISKRLGPPCVGIVKHIADAKTYAELAAPYTWIKKYPDWETKPVYFVEIEQGVIPFTAQEIAENENVSLEEAEEAFNRYKELNIKHTMLAYPEDDLEGL